MSAVLGILVAATIVAVPRRSPVRRTHDVGVAAGPDSDMSGSRGVAALLDRAAVDFDARRVPSVWSAVAGAAAVVGFVVAGRGGSVVAVAAVSAGPVVWLIARGDRRRRRIVASLPQLMELVARGLRGGADLRSSLREAADALPVAGLSLHRALARVDAGERVGEALDSWAVELDHPDAAIVRSVLRLGDETGAAMATALDRAAATLRERAALRHEISALTAQTRASSMVVALAPLGFLLVVALTDPGSAGVLFTTAWGRVCLMVGIGLDMTGLVWMRRLTDRVSS